MRRLLFAIRSAPVPAEISPQVLGLLHGLDSPSNHMPAANLVCDEASMPQLINSSGTTSSGWSPMYFLARAGQVFGDHGTDLAKEPEKRDIRQKCLGRGQGHGLRALGAAREETPPGREVPFCI